MEVREELIEKLEAMKSSAMLAGKLEAFTDIREIIYKTINPTQTLKDILAYMDENSKEGKKDA